MKFKDEYQIPYSEELARPPLAPNEQIENASEQLKNLSNVIQEKLTPIIQALIPTIQAFIDSVAPVIKETTDIVLKYYPNKRVLYLAIHGNRRVRKKNFNRIMKWLERGGNDGM